MGLANSSLMALKIDLGRVPIARLSCAKEFTGWLRYIGLVVVVGDSFFSTAWILLGTGEMPLRSMTWPRKTSCSI